MSQDTAQKRLSRLRRRLDALLTVREATVPLPRAGKTYRILAPADTDRLLDAAESDPEQNLPYWAEIWPSGIALADVALARADELAGLPVLELGSGIGITAAAALEAGARLLAADYSTASLTLCRHNALANAGREPQTIAINWREPPQELLDAAESDPEQNLPYWAEIWPSGIALADVALARAGELAGLPVLELGSGIGITAAAALEAGARLLAADYSTASLTLCRHNALANAGREPQTIAINWREPPQELLDRADALRGYPVILAADVLYEPRDIAPMLAITWRLLAPGGALWLAEPGRETARRFLTAADEMGWRRESTHHDGPWAENSQVRVGLHTLRKPQEGR